MAVKMTEKQRRAVEAVAAAERAGLSLQDYAQARGLAVRELYDAIAGLRRRGVLPRSSRARVRKRHSSGFLPVRVVAAAPMPAASPGSPRGGLVCRLVHASGFVLECGEWPPAPWLVAVASGWRDAAS